MKTLVILLASSMVMNEALAIDPPSDKLAFAYEMVRHGARSPLIDEPAGLFSVGTGILTASGMRQRYLLGQWSR